MCKNQNGENGQALVEFALTLPLLLLLLLGIVDFGRILGVAQIVSEAARDGTRYASIDDTDAQVGQAVQNDTVVLGSGVGWSITPSGVRSSGDIATVSVQSTIAIIDPIMMMIVGAKHTVTSSFSMRVE